MATNEASKITHTLPEYVLEVYLSEDGMADNDVSGVIFSLGFARTADPQRIARLLAEMSLASIRAFQLVNMDFLQKLQDKCGVHVSLSALGRIRTAVAHFYILRNDEAKHADEKRRSRRKELRRHRNMGARLAKYVRDSSNAKARRLTDVWRQVDYERRLPRRFPALDHLIVDLAKAWEEIIGRAATYSREGPFARFLQVLWEILPHGCAKSPEAFAARAEKIRKYLRAPRRRLRSGQPAG